MLGAVVRPSGHPQPTSLRDLPREATHFSFRRAPTGAPAFLATSGDRPPLRPETPQPPAAPRQALRGDAESPATVLLNRERHHGNGKQRLGRRAGGSKLREQLTFRARWGGRRRRLSEGRCAAIVSGGRNTSRPLLRGFGFFCGFLSNGLKFSFENKFGSAIIK